MKGPIELSPLGTAQAALAGASLVTGPGASSAPEPEIALLGWLGQVREQLRTLYNLEDEIAFIAWELARWQPGISLIERQALILLIITVQVHLRLGSTRIVWRGERGRALQLSLAQSLLSGIKPTTGFDTLLDPGRAVELMEMLVSSNRAVTLVGTGDEFKPLALTGEHLSFQKMTYLEDRFVKSMHRRLAADIPGWSMNQIDGALRDVCARPAIHGRRAINLENEQQTAVRAAVQNPVTIISGGPGTGKTTIVVSILRVLRRLGIACEEMVLAAPTGKAANRMKEAVQIGLAEIAEQADTDRDLLKLAEPRTLHRLLGYVGRTGRFLHHENNRLAQRVIIVDEGSMIDLTLMERLLRSLRDDSRFILLGDARQLPSIEAGAVLRDLLAENDNNVPAKHWCIRLTHSYRMRRDEANGRNILAVAQTIDQGIIPGLAPSRTSDEAITRRSSVETIKFEGVEFLDAPAGSEVPDHFLDRWYREVIGSLAELGELTGHEFAIIGGRFNQADERRLHTLFEHWGKFRILCATRVLLTGADRVNAVLHQHAVEQCALRQRVRDIPDLREDGSLIPGEPVMMQVNDYKRMIFNGDQGLILNVSDGSKLNRMAVFPGSEGFLAFPAESIRPDLQLSYAMTVHKAQGSEFDQVALILPDRDLPICTREILYTALTRSRMSAVLIGSQETFKSAIARTISRDSGIADKLRGSRCE